MCSSDARDMAHEDASDLTQAFFARFLEKRYLQSVDSSRGKELSMEVASRTEMTRAYNFKQFKIVTQGNKPGERFISLQDDESILFENSGCAW